jgi:hypothetical protein
MLVVISIIGILVGIALPTINNLGRSDSVLASTRQMLDDVARARQYAISQRTTVYMVFCPSNFWTDVKYGAVSASAAEKPKAEKLYGKQLNSYTFVTLRSVGEQPGKSSPLYLQSWKALPEGAIIANWKFAARLPAFRVTDPLDLNRTFDVKGFSVTNSIPFPSAEAAVLGAPYVSLPYIAFNHLGQLDSGEDEYIPLARGTVSYARDANKVPTQAAPNVAENPPGISTNAYSLVHIDWLTGRARLEKQEFK